MKLSMKFWRRKISWVMLRKLLFRLKLATSTETLTPRHVLSIIQVEAFTISHMSMTGRATSKWPIPNWTSTCLSLYSGLPSDFIRAEELKLPIICARWHRKSKLPKENSLERRRIRRRSSSTLISERKQGWKRRRSSTLYALKITGKPKPIILKCIKFSGTRSRQDILICTASIRSVASYSMT